MKQKTALPSAHDAGMVVTDRGSMSRIRAKELGYAITGSESTNGEPNAADAFASWRVAIECLPEARERASATAELLASQTYATLTVESARAFLRGLPTEQKEEQPKVSTNQDPRAARKAEIAGSMASFNKDRGYRAPKAAPSRAAGAATVDPTKLKRLAEIRLNALQMGAAGTNAGEMKKLAYAMQVHSTTGLPLATVFSQLDVDTSKIIRS